MQNGPVASSCPRKLNTDDFTGICLSGMCFPPSGSKPSSCFCKHTHTHTPKAHCYRSALDLARLTPSVASLTVMELFKDGAINHNEIALLKASCLWSCFPGAVSQLLQVNIILQAKNLHGSAAIAGFLPGVSLVHKSSWQENCVPLDWQEGLKHLRCLNWTVSLVGNT